MRKKNSTHNEEGYVLIATLLIMLVLTIIGIAANRNTSTELQIASNDKIHKKTFYAAEAGAILAAELVEQNLNCPMGFNTANVEGSIRILNPIFGQQQSPVGGECEIVGNDELADISFYLDDIESGGLVGSAGDPETHLYIWGNTKMLPGGSLIMAAGYEGKGESAASAGVQVLFDIFSQHLGLTNSETIIAIGWRHLVGNESTCYY